MWGGGVQGVCMGIGASQTGSSTGSVFEQGTLPALPGSRLPVWPGGGNLSPQLAVMGVGSHGLLHTELVPQDACPTG